MTPRPITVAVNRDRELPPAPAPPGARGSGQRCWFIPGSRPGPFQRDPDSHTWAPPATPGQRLPEGCRSRWTASKRLSAWGLLGPTAQAIGSSAQPSTPPPRCCRPSSSHHPPHPRAGARKAEEISRIATWRSRASGSTLLERAGGAASNSWAATPSGSETERESCKDHRREEGPVAVQAPGGGRSPPQRLGESDWSGLVRRLRRPMT